MLLRRKVKLAQTQETFDEQVDMFLAREGFELTQDNRAMFASAIQHSDSADDTFDPKYIACQMRKAVAQRLAFYVIYPSKRPKAPSGPEEAKAVNGEVAQEA